MLLKLNDCLRSASTRLGARAVETCVASAASVRASAAVPSRPALTLVLTLAPASHLLPLARYLATAWRCRYIVAARSSIVALKAGPTHVSFSERWNLEKALWRLLVFEWTHFVSRWWSGFALW